MKILVVNCGSSSLKYQLLNMEDETVLARGLIERIGLEDASLTHQGRDAAEITMETPVSHHSDGIKLVLHMLQDREHGVISSLSDINAVGHRVVHGGEKFARSVLISPAVKEAIKACYDMAPLHNPPNITGIDACAALMPGIPQVAVFDTAFHLTMPQHAFLYGLPYEAYKKYGIRKYGFHGTSHKFVAARAAVLLGRPLARLKIITCHLGNGSSVAAVKGGLSVDTSMGFTPLEGLVMGTRCGDIDPAVIPYLMRKEGFTPAQMDTYMNKESGIYGVSGLSSDFRDLEEAAQDGHERAALALDVYAYRVRRYIGAYVVALNGVDAVVLTAGLAENSVLMRRRIITGLECLGMHLDPLRNEALGEEAEISTAHSPVKIFVIPTNEELVIARETVESLGPETVHG